MRIDAVVAERSSQGCNNRPFDYQCEETWQGGGISGDGTVWTLTAVLHMSDTHYCYGWVYRGTWSLVTAGGADSLFGDFTGRNRWRVTGGTGAYAGATDVNASGSNETGFVQDSLPANPVTPAVGATAQAVAEMYGAQLPLGGPCPEDAYLLPTRHGSLLFTINQ